jgi:hypothetical protein
MGREVSTAASVDLFGFSEAHFTTVGKLAASPVPRREEKIHCSSNGLQNAQRNPDPRQRV